MWSGFIRPFDRSFWKEKEASGRICADSRVHLIAPVPHKVPSSVALSPRFLGVPLRCKQMVASSYWEGQSHLIPQTSVVQPSMLGETWDQVAGWGLETIKNIQTQVGLADQDTGCLRRMSDSLIMTLDLSKLDEQAPHARKGQRRVSFCPGDTVGGCVAKAVHINARAPSPEAQLSDKGDAFLRRQESRVRKMNSSTEDAAIFKGRSLSLEDCVSIGIQRSLSSRFGVDRSVSLELTSPTRATSASSRRSLPKKLVPSTGTPRS